MKQKMIEEIKSFRKAIKMENELIDMYFSTQDYDHNFYEKIILCYERINNYEKEIGDLRIKLLRLGLKKYLI